MITAKDRDMLAKGVCETLIETRGYHNAWIALFGESRNLATTAESGLGEAFMPMAKQLEGGTLTHCAQKALSQSSVVVIADPLSTCTDCQLAKMYAGRGAMAVRLEYGGKLYGLLCVSIPVNFVNDEEEQYLLKELAEDISFGLYSIEAEEERAQAEKAIQGSEERYRGLVETVTDIIFTLDNQGKFTYLNPEAERIAGYTTQDLTGHLFTKVLAPEYRESTADRFRRGLSGEAIPIYEVDLLHKNGKKVSVELNVTSLLDAEGKIIGMIGIARDIIERQKAEQALRDSETQKKAILDGSIDRIRLVDKDMRILWANKTTTRELNITPEDLVGQLCYEAFVGRDSPCSECPTKKAFNSGNIEHAVLHQPYSKGIEGETYWDAYSVPIKDELGDIVNLIQVTRNITDKVKTEEEKKKLEAQLQQAQRLEGLGTLAAEITHNFNNLLVSIQGNASIALLDIDSSHPHYKNLKNIEKQVQSGSKLTAQLLGYAREGRYEVKLISLNQLVKETSDSFGMTKKEIRIHQELAEKLYGVKVDDGQIEQFLLNLYVNAADAMPGGGDLFLKTMNVTDEDMTGKPYEPKPGNYVLLTVRDTGVGMDKKTMEHIFDPFFTTKGLSKGTGLGLASTYGIVKAHGGYIDVDSKKGHARPPRLSPAERDDGGQGTTFSIYLPASERKVEKPVKNAEHIIEGTGTILLVDDEEMVLDMGVQLLKRLGYTALEAKGGREAVEIYQKNKAKIDMVILDMIMPGMGGGEAYDRMKEINPGIKVLLSSGYSIDGQATEIVARGCDGFIQKPFNVKELSQEVRKILDI